MSVIQADTYEVTEIQDAIGACDELHTVLSRLRRHGLLSDREDREIDRSVDIIADTLTSKLSEPTYHWR
ncbi:MAG TPA: hypothetical protein VF221_12030 [Chloroflexota bacterium]